jgi:hypothetical protein
MSNTELLTTDEYAQLRRCSRRTLERERAVGRGCPYVKLGARILYRRRDIDQFLAANLRGYFHQTAESSGGGHRRKGDGTGAVRP